MRRIITLVIGALLALSVAAPMALAQEEGRGGAPQDAGGSFVLNPGDYPGTCGFPMLLELSGKSKTIEELPGERLIIASPDQNVTITNLDNGAQQAFNITGSIHQRALANGDVETVLTGRNLAIDPEAGTVVAVGRFSFIFDASGNLVQPLTGEGQLIDVCARLV